jgi:hypothetical protein
LLWCCPRAPLVTAALLSAARAFDYRIPPARRRRRQSHSVSARSSPARVSSASVLCPASGFASRQRRGSERAEEFLLALVPRTRWRCLRRQAVLITRGFRPTATGTLCGVLLAGWPAPFASHVSRQRFCAPVVLVVSCYMCPAVPGVSCCPWCVLLSLAPWRLLSGSARCQTPRCFGPLLRSNSGSANSLRVVAVLVVTIFEFKQIQNLLFLIC